jgi:pseudo-response regulator 5
LKVTPVATAELTECITPVSNVNLNLTSVKNKSPASSAQDMLKLPSSPIKSVPVPFSASGFPLDQLYSRSIPMQAPENNHVTEIEEVVEMNTAPASGDPLVEENNKEMSKGVPDSRSCSLSVSTMGPTIPSLVNPCIGNTEGFRCLTQRDIALNKFRLKRKERCFEKKVHFILLSINTYVLMPAVIPIS